jgi:hypothetical protein
METTITSTSGSGSGGIVLIVVLLVALFVPFSILVFHSGHRTKRTNQKEGGAWNNSGEHEAVLTQDQNGTTSSTRGLSQRQAGSSSEISMRIPFNDSVKKEVERVERGATKKDNGKNSNWRCACEGGFLPPGIFGNAEAVLRMGSGQCYHKQ